MTIDEKRVALENWCDGHGECGTCVLNGFPEIDCDFVGKCHAGDSVWSDERIEEAYGAVFSSKVNHPKHYNREGGMECIEEMLLIFGREAVKHFCLCNAWKYRYRASDKNGAEDLNKSDWYLAKYKELLGGDDA